MKKNKVINIILILLSVIFTILVKIIDLKPVGINETNIGFQTINKRVFEFIGVNNIWYTITEILGIISILIAAIYALIGLIQFIKRKNILKVDREILILAALYISVIIIYIFFEKVIINYRPILINGQIEASYPSSHTLLSICICQSAIIINKKLFNNSAIKYINILLTILIILTVLGRLLSGYHWLTDIIGGILISQALISTFYNVINKR